MAPTLFVWAFGFLLLGYGYAVSHSRIAGGSTASIQKHSSMAMVESYNAFTNVWVQSCGCVILTRFWVMSAAQCFDGRMFSPENRRIRAGTNIRHTGGQLSMVKQVINHPDFGPDSFVADISMIRLQEPLTYTPVVQQAVLAADTTRLPANTPVTVAGWGVVSAGSLASNELQAVETLTADIEECKNHYMSLPTPGLVTDDMICTGLAPGSGNACQGDQGGPIYYDDIVVGIHSFGNACSGDGVHYPGVGTAIAPYLDWILAIANS